MHPAKVPLDESRFAAAVNDPEVKYGLPREVRFCRSCVISNQRPNSAVEFSHTPASKKDTIHFDDEGVCDACRVAERKQSAIDWRARGRELELLCDRFRGSDGSYDCLVPGSGGKARSAVFPPGAPSRSSRGPTASGSSTATARAGAACRASSIAWSASATRSRRAC